jgi:ABC-2 type transport system ATP-binding protein
MEAMIEADHLAKTFEDGTVAVRDATFGVAGGEVLALLGPNGAGKTTVVHMLLGHLPPTSGHARVRGIDVHAKPLEAKRHLGYVSENVLLHGTLTAAQNLRFFCRISGALVPAQRQAEALGRVGLAEAARRPVEAFSKGMRQRLGIAIAIAKDPAAILMDEPTSGLDPVGAREFGELVVALRGEGKALLLVTHDLFHARDLADRVVLVRGGVAGELPKAAGQDLDALYQASMHASEVVRRGP